MTRNYGIFAQSLDVNGKFFALDTGDADYINREAARLDEKGIVFHVIEGKFERGAWLTGPDDPRWYRVGGNFPKS